MNFTNLCAVITAGILSLVVLYAAWAMIKMRSELDAALDRLHFEKKKRRAVEERLTRTELRVQEFAAKMAPLIAKTDWMTGRWGGQFATLVRLEEQRNLDVDNARKALFEIPMIKRNPINPTPYSPKGIEK
jgi:hypothetical protein